MKKLKTCWISKKLRVQNCIIENKGNDFNFSKNENHMRNEKMERIINIEDSVIKHSHQDTVSHILVVHQWQVCLMHNLIRVWFSNSFICYKNQKHFNQFTMSLLFCVILFYIIFLVSAAASVGTEQRSTGPLVPLYFPLSEFVNTGGTI